LLRLRRSKTPLVGKKFFDDNLFVHPFARWGLSAEKCQQLGEKLKEFH